MSDLPQGDLILRPERQRLVPISDTTIWRMEQRGEFPRRIPISPGRVAWLRSEIEILAFRSPPPCDRPGHGAYP